jgi:hypothetical protein
MFAIIGIVVLLGMVFGGFIFTGGDIGPVLHALPHEMLIIGGAAVGALIIGNSGADLKALGGGLGKVFKGPKYKKQDFLDCIFLVARLMKMLRVEGPGRAGAAYRGSALLLRVQRISQAGKGPWPHEPDLRHVTSRRRVVRHARPPCGRGGDG